MRKSSAIACTLGLYEILVPFSLTNECPLLITCPTWFWLFFTWGFLSPGSDFRILLLLAWVPSCRNAPGKWGNHHLWGFLRKGHVWHLGMWLSGHGGDGLTVGPGGFSDLPQPLWLYDSKVIQLQEAYFVKHQWCVLYLSNSEVGVTDFTEVCFLPQQRRQFHICKKFL